MTCRRNSNSKKQSDKNSIAMMSTLIVDSAADQCTCGGPAWVVIETTGEEVQCNGYLKGKEGFTGPTLPIVNAVTCVQIKGEEPFLLIMNQACYYDEEEQDESLCLPFQAMQHGVTFDLTPKNRRSTNGEVGTQRMIVGGRQVPLEYDGRKMYLNIRRPTEDELNDLETYEITSPLPFIPDSEENYITWRRKNAKKDYKKYPGGITMDEWRKRLALAPEDVIRKTFEATTQLAMSVEAENRDIPRRHYKSRFPFLREKRVNDIFHSDTFFPSVHTNNGETCSQLFLGRNTDYMYVQPMKKESHSFIALQDFGRKVGLPKGIKTDNAQTEVGEKWTGWCRQHCVDTKFTEPHSPWQNIAEQGIGDLSRMVCRCMREFKAPLSRHAWCQKWCCDVRNHLASRKLGWRTATEKLTGDTPDISVFRFHFWEPIEYYEPCTKQPGDGWLKGRFLGIAWDSGDSLTYYIETEKPKGKGRNVILIRSTVRSRQFPSSNSLQIVPSGENEFNESMDEANVINTIQSEVTINNEHEDVDMNTDNAEGIEFKSKDGNENMIHNNQDKEMDSYDLEEAKDDALEDWNEIGIEADDQALVNEELMDIANGNEEDYEFDSITGHKWENGILVLEILLSSGKKYKAPFSLIKKDRPIELAKYIRKEVIETKRGGWYESWAKGVLKQAGRTIRRMHRYYNTGRIERLRISNEIKVRRLSRNKRLQNKKNRVKFGIKVPNNVREAIIFDKENKNNLWAEAIMKEMTALEKAGVFEFHPPHHQVSKEYQYCPLRIIFDIKQEDLRRKARMVAGGHVVNSTMFESYSSVVQTRTIRLLETIAMNEGLEFMTGDIGNAFVHAFTKEKVYSKAGKEFGNREGCVVVIKKALYGLATSARQWNLALGDVIRKMGFKPSRADPDLWIKESNDGKIYEYIATYVDDIIIVAKEPEVYLKKIQDVFPIRDIEKSPSYYLGNNLEIRENETIKVSSQKYITEVIRKYESKHGPLRKENVPASPNDHPEEDDTPFLNEEGTTQFQSIIGICQWISIAGRFDITFAVSSLSRFSAQPREGHLKRSIKILGYLKKYPKRGYIVDPRPPVVNVKYEKIEPDFGNQYTDFKEDEDDRLPTPKMSELPITIFVDSNHGHDKKTGKSITGLIVFVGRTPIYWASKRQGAVQTSTFGAEFVALKRAVEEAVTTRYWLKSMGVSVTKPTVIYGDNLSAITNTIEPSSPLKKKYLALAYHFCREHFSAGIVDIRKIDGKDNYADPFTKALVSTEFHGHMKEIMVN
jgi:hypothetical protein